VTEACSREAAGAKGDGGHDGGGKGGGKESEP